MYLSMFGSVGVMLRHAHHFSSVSADLHGGGGDEASEGWRRIRQVAALRKVARKLRQKCRQIDQDIEVWIEFSYSYSYSYSCSYCGDEVRISTCTIIIILWLLCVVCLGYERL
jgi:hypothetical protein